jgi:hypothetical protein
VGIFRIETMLPGEVEVNFRHGKLNVFDEGDGCTDMNSKC